MIIVIKNKQESYVCEEIYVSDDQPKKGLKADITDTDKKRILVYIPHKQQ